MKYYDVSTRKRPDFNELYDKLLSMLEPGEGLIGAICQCGLILNNKQFTFEHWNEGHFDTYDEVKEKPIYNTKVDGVKRSEGCVGCPSFPYSLCGPCARHNGVI